MKLRVHLLALLSCLFAVLPVRAVVYRSDGLGADVLASEVSSLNWVGSWGGFAATVVSPCQFITAAHVGGSVGQSFTLNGQAYTAKEVNVTGDVAVWTFYGNVADYAPIAGRAPSIGDRVITAGTGMIAGDPFITAGTQVGWRWTGSNGALHWGENTVVRAVDAFIRTEFTRDNPLRYESSLATGDSGGPLFVQQDGIWALAGIAYGVSSVHTDIDNGGVNILAASWDRYAAWRYPGPPLVGDWSYYSTLATKSDWLVPIPEPGTTALMAAGLVLLLSTSNLHRKQT